MDLSSRRTTMRFARRFAPLSGTTIRPRGASRTPYTDPAKQQMLLDIG
jgi:hypothetical protein